MSYFDEENNVESYIEMARGYNSFNLIDKLDAYLSPGAQVLELGMGPGVDLEYLARKYDVTGSDLSEEFLSRYRKAHPGVKTLKLDALTIYTEQSYDCIFSAKVLQHLKKDELVFSLRRQSEVLNNNGLVLHSLWLGEGSESYDGLFFQYSKDELISVFEQFFKIEECWVYSEMDENDSVAVVGRKLN